MKGVKGEDYGKFLKIIYGTSKHENVSLLRLVQYLEASAAEQKCLQFLMVDAEKNVKEKFQLADRFRLEPLIAFFFVNKNASLFICFS
ncbi:hypothetical protein CAEBREN_04138 [Caenorhabditis brenneri]|uniref:BTB domain-containing protein n=1 Tax=Caenorhabditis brenneri TaxID=135651 RepID=G0NV44_CAEBE|nr:hypothetical protein CAEBREN_04138 [Caenorhabditis brenneri]